MNYSSALFTLLAIIATSSASQAQSTNQTKFEKKEIKYNKRLNKRHERNKAKEEALKGTIKQQQQAANVPTTSPSYTPTEWPTWFPTTDQTKAPVTRKPTRPPRTPRPTKHPTPIPTPNTPQLNQNGLVIAVDDTISLQSGTTEAFIAVLENDTGSNLIVRAITSQPTNGQCSISLNLSEVVYIPNDTNFVGSDQCTYETCDDEEDCDTAIVRINIGSAPPPPTPPTPTPPTPPTACDLGTIVDVAEKNGFDTLVAAVEAAGLVDTLNGDGPFTVFGTFVICFDIICCLNLIVLETYISNTHHMFSFSTLSNLQIQLRLMRHSRPYQQEHLIHSSNPRMLMT